MVAIIVESHASALKPPLIVDTASQRGPWHLARTCLNGGGSVSSGCDDPSDTSDSRILHPRGQAAYGRRVRLETPNGSRSYSVLTGAEGGQSPTACGADLGVFLAWNRPKLGTSS